MRLLAADAGVRFSYLFALCLATDLVFSRRRRLVGLTSSKLRKSVVGKCSLTQNCGVGAEALESNLELVRKLKTDLFSNGTLRQLLEKRAEEVAARSRRVSKSVRVNGRMTGAGFGRKLKNLLSIGVTNIPVDYAALGARKPAGSDVKNSTLAKLLTGKRKRLVRNVDEATTTTPFMAHTAQISEAWDRYVGGLKGETGPKKRIVALADPIVPDLYVLQPGVTVHEIDLVARGALIVQSKASAMSVAALRHYLWTHLIGAKAWKHVCDLAEQPFVDCCAAPGNKTLQLLDTCLDLRRRVANYVSSCGSDRAGRVGSEDTAGSNGTSVLAFERDARRAEELEARMERHGAGEDVHVVKQYVFVARTVPIVPREPPVVYLFQPTLVAYHRYAL